MSITKTSPRTFLGAQIPNVKVLSSKIDEIITKTNEISSAEGVVKSDSITELTTGAGVTISGQKKTIVDGSGATVTITASQSGSTFLFDRLAGITYTLPTAAEGLEFTFVTSISNTSNSNSIEGATSADLMIGSLVNIDTDSSNAVAAWRPNGSSNYKITGNATTTAFLKGSVIKLKGLGTNLWHVEGVTQSSGVVATPFAG
jgi:hypothetical protein